MSLKSRCNLLCLAVVYAVFVAVHSDLVSKPRDTEAVVGDSTYFDCASNVNRNEVNWFYYAVGAKDHEDICIYCLGKIHRLYKNRIQIERHNTGNSRLRIKSVHLDDAGRYICQDNGGIGESATAQLVVLESSPTCTSNIKPDDLLGPNSCNIEPDELFLSCSVSYNGNIPPIIQWRKIRTADPMNKGSSCQNIGNRVSCHLRMNADLGLNGASYVCETKGSATTQYNCTSDIIRIIYAKTTISAKETILGSGEKVNCSANSSQPCSYLWKWFDGVDEEVVSNDSVLIPWKIGWHKCEANCNIRGKSCMVLSKVVHVPEAKAKSDHVENTWFLVTCFTLVVGFQIVLFLCIYGCCCWRRDSGSCCWCRISRSRNKEPLLTGNSKTNTDQLEMKRLNSSDANGKAIYGLAILGKEIFVVRQSSTNVEVYDITTLISKREWNFEELQDPWDIASCKINKCVYIVEVNGIIRFDPDDNESIIEMWPTGGAYGLLSVTPEANILLAVQSRRKINEYSPKGELLREFRLSELSNQYPLHAVKLANERFMVSFGCIDESPQGILIFNGEIMIASSGNSEVPPDHQVNVPMQMCVTSSESILVLDAGNSRVVELNAALEFQKELVSSKDGLLCPFRICLDEANSILFVANNGFDFYTLQQSGKILAFKITNFCKTISV